MARAKTGEAAIGDAAVQAKTGRIWKEWFKILDKWGAKKKDHKTIARHLHERHRLSGWWAQTVTVRYEQERGLRVVGQTSRGFEATVSRTIRTSPRKAYDAFTKAAVLSVWFNKASESNPRVGGRYSNSGGDKGEYLLLQPPRRLRFSWDNAKAYPGTRVEVTIERKPPGKVVVRLTHSKLPSQAAFKNMKGGWSWALDSLKSYLETGRPIAYEEWKKSRKKR